MRIASRGQHRYALTEGGEAGISLIDTIVGTALMLVIFLGIAAAFQLSVDLVMSNKARAGAIALLNERMEFVKSVSYVSLGTVGGIPAGSLAQNETIALNGISFERRTLIAYYDDATDGSAGGDSNGIDADSKTVKVEVSWVSRTGPRTVMATARIAPVTGLESAVSGGTLAINAVDAQGAPLSGATVLIVNDATAVNLTTYTNAAGTVRLIGTPAGSGYAVTVTKPGYSTARTHEASTENTNPNPGNLTVSNTVTTSSTFAIDVLGTKTVRTFTPITGATTTDSYTDASGIATSSSITVSGGNARISGSAPFGTGTLRSTAVSPSYLVRWKALSWTSSEPASTDILLQVYDASSLALISDSQLPGNAAGFTSSPVDLSGISASTHPALAVFATLTGADETPTLSAWNIAYDYGPVPLPNIAFTLSGAKTIGSGPSGSVYKYSATHNSGPSSSVTISNLEWDNYSIDVPASSGYSVAAACNPQPESLAPGGSQTSALYLMPYTAHSALIDVRSAATGALLPNATVRLTRTGYNKALVTDSCGQAFFSSLASATYTIEVTLPGYTTYTGTNEVSVSGATKFSVTLNN